MNFIAIDVETANASMASICQIGVAKYENATLVQEWSSYIDPEDYFDELNVAIHGIDESTVANAPSFSDLHDTLCTHFENAVVVCHTHFDRVAMHQAAARYDVMLPKCVWLDSALVARRTWSQCARRGYGLGDVCRMLGYEFRHHDALEDAKAAAHILVSASKMTGLDVDGWLSRLKRPVNPGSTKRVTRDGDPDGAYYGNVLVFTGALEMPRREAATLAASIGCAVASRVSKKTTILVVGDQDAAKLAGHEKSSKHREAEALVAAGVPIRILREADFKQLVAICS